MITHHPDIATLLTCAAGSQPEALAAVMAAHLAVCPPCRAHLADAQVIGEALFEVLPPVQLARAVPTPCACPSHKAHALAPQTALAHGSSITGDIPLPLVGVLGHHLSAIQWDKVTAGVWTAPVPLSEHGNGTLHLLKLAPGITQPCATASYAKLTLVLSGSYTDGDQTFLPGDVADFDVQTNHHIAADAQTGCICLVAVDR
jgi:putative transcriptional regulator